MWFRFSRLAALEVTIESGYPLMAQTIANEVPVLPPVNSTTPPPSRNFPSASAASIIANAIRSFMLPVGFVPSSFASSRALPGGTTFRS